MRYPYLLIWLVQLYFLTAHASVINPLVNSVNVITGEASNPTYLYEYYNVGKNDVGETSIQLAKGDFRIGRVKLQKNPTDNVLTTYFLYYPYFTEVRDARNHKSIYRYSQIQCLEAVEYYLKDGTTLYRKECLFWDTSDHTNPKIKSRFLQDATGSNRLGCLFTYNKKGQLVQETIIGNLSGTCLIPLLVRADGSLIDNGIEQYSAYYTYDAKDPTLLIEQSEDNGTKTLYQYDPYTKQCTAKFKSDQKGIHSRCFYFYDAQGFLTRTLLDDGKSSRCGDLTNVTMRQIVETQLHTKEPVANQPATIASKYVDLATGQEKLIERVVHHYDAQAHLIQKDFHDAQDQLRYTLYMHYDDRGELIATLDSRGEEQEAPKQELTYRYDEGGQRTTSIDAYGNETQYIYDEFGRLLQTIYPPVLDDADRPVQFATSNTYDICNNAVTVQDANGSLTSTTYNARGKPIETIYPDGSRSSSVYFLDGTLKESISQEGRRTVFERDAFGRVLSTQEWMDEHWLGQTLYSYRGANLQSISDGKTFTTTFSYDGAGRQIAMLQTTRDGSKRCEWGYNACGEKTICKEWFGPGDKDFAAKIEEKDAWEQTTATRLEDAAGNAQKRMTVATPQQSLFAQDGCSVNERQQFVRRQENIDARGMRAVVLFDALERAESLIVYDPFGRKTSEKHMRYDGKGNKILEHHIVLVGGNATGSYTIAWSYDSLNRLIAVKEGATAPKLTQHLYNERGQLCALVKPDGTTLHYLYDQAGHLAQLYSSDGTLHYRYAYDEAHRLTVAEDLIQAERVERRYNDFNEMIEESWGPHVHLKHHYDLAGRRTHLVLPDQSSIGYQYAGALLQTVQRFNAKHELQYQHAYSYNYPQGHIIESQLIGNLGSISYSYDAQGRPLSIHSPWWSETLQAFDIDNCLTHMTINDPVGQMTSMFTYDAMQQVEHTPEGYYEYDSLHNRIIHNEQPWTVNAHNQLIATPQATYQYDANGNLATKQTHASHIDYTYDALSRLTRVCQAKEWAIDYYYDALYRRIAQKKYQWDGTEWQLIAHERYLFDGDKEIGTIDATGTLTQLRVLGAGKGAEIGTAIALELQGRLVAPIHDHRGSICCLIDVATQQVAECYRYSTFGSTQVFDGQGNPLDGSRVGNAWRFASKRYSVETGLIGFGKRDYDPEIGRWTTPDPLSFGDGPNLYAFVHNNPLTHSDLYGLFGFSTIWDTIVNSLFASWYYLQHMSHQVWSDLGAELGLHADASTSFKRVGQQLVGESFLMLMGYGCHERSEVGQYGNGEISDKVRVTFINGIFNTRSALIENLDLISETHGGVNIHYVFRPTGGWTSDISRALAIKMAYNLGFRSIYAHLLAQMWRKLIQEMGGTEGGGVIVHYAHSLGGSDTDRARTLLTAEEQKMIRVITFGSATLIRNEGFQSVTHYVSLHDGVSNNFFVEPLGHLRNFFNSETNIIFKSYFFALPFFPFDHLLGGMTYRSILEELGEKFLADFAPLLRGFLITHLTQNE